MNSIHVIGNLGDDPELRYTPGGDAVCSFSVADTPRTKDSDGNWKDGTTAWFKVECWNALAENVAESFHKGDRVVAVGHIIQQNYEADDGGKRSVFKVRAEDVAPSLKWATAVVTRQAKGGGD